MNLSQNNFLNLLLALEYNGLLPNLSSKIRIMGTKYTIFFSIYSSKPPPETAILL